MKRILVTLAHPDDEAFGPGGTLAKYSFLGAEIHLLFATKGESGKNYLKKTRNHSLPHIREMEARKSAKILGCQNVSFLGFIDGELKQNNYHKLAQAIINKIEKFRPDLILTYEEKGVSGHLDHIALSLTTTYAFLKTKIAKKLYYYCLPKEQRNPRHDNYFIYFPEGYLPSEITTRIHFKKYWPTKVKAMKCHKSQAKDVARVLNDRRKWPKIDYFILKHHFLKKVSLPETDLFAGI